MTTTPTPPSWNPDPAAILGAAVSLKKICEETARREHINLSECYNGGDEFMRQVMRVTTLFETWCCEHIDFHQCSEVWPYLLEDRFGEAFLEVSYPTCLDEFDGTTCLRVAMQLMLPVKVTEGLAVPVNLAADNPNAESTFRRYQIRTVWRHHEDQDISQFTPSDDPEDERYGPVFFGLYGIEADGTAEHIADRDSYAQARALIVKLAPGINFPTAPTLRDSFSAK